jgi:hypothetical protein
MQDRRNGHRFHLVPLRSRGMVRRKYGDASPLWQCRGRDQDCLPIHGRLRRCNLRAGSVIVSQQVFWCDSCASQGLMSAEPGEVRDAVQSHIDSPESPRCNIQLLARERSDFGLGTESEPSGGVGTLHLCRVVAQVLAPDCRGEVAQVEGAVGCRPPASRSSGNVQWVLRAWVRRQPAMSPPELGVERHHGHGRKGIDVHVACGRP